MAQFIVVEHHAKRAGLHYDLRFEKPNSNMWLSFASRHELTEAEKTKILLNQTEDHTKEDALFIGEIKSGYGAGILKEWDKGTCDILKYREGKYIQLKFKGRKLKGIYHLIKVAYKENSWLFFKAK